MPNLFVQGDFVLHSGERSWFKIDADALSEQDLATMALYIVSLIGHFGSVEGVPRGGLALARALVPYLSIGPTLIVDDVYTTGTSMLEKRGDRRNVKGAVIFARTVPPPWIIPVFTLTEAAE